MAVCLLLQFFFLKQADKKIICQKIFSKFSSYLILYSHFTCSNVDFLKIPLSSSMLFQLGDLKQHQGFS